MHGCWAYNPAQRPNFSILVNAIGEILAEDAEYFTFRTSPVSSIAPLIPKDANEHVSEEDTSI